MHTMSTWFWQKKSGMTLPLAFLLSLLFLVVSFSSLLMSSSKVGAVVVSLLTPSSYQAVSEDDSGGKNIVDLADQKKLRPD